jgi:L-aminopeptidase/D-esterase-like protein
MTDLRNLITDVAGLRIGNAHDARLASGVTVALFEGPAVASCAVLGGAPGTRETDLLEPDKMVPGIDAVVLSGG